MKTETLKNFSLIIFAIVIIFTSFFLIQHNGKVMEIKELKVKYEIGERAGFNIESENLNFGRLIPGNKGTRSISIYNSHDFPINAKIVTSIDLKGILIFNESNQYILPNETLNMPITLMASKQAITGNYTGFVRVQIFST